MAENKKVPLTQDAYDRLRRELDHLQGEGRQKIIDDIARARAHGDLSENAEYHAARDEQARQEARVRELAQMLEHAEIISAADDDPTVKPGKVVTLRYEGGDAETYLFGMRAERSLEHDVLTPDSPIGRSIEGRRVGEKVTANAPAGDLQIEIAEVRAP